MKNQGAFAAVGLLAGLLFGAGLVVSGMTLPSKVRGFLDFAGDWDPTLVFVMGGAVLVHLVAHRLVRERAHPLLADRFQLPTRKDIDARLVVGAALFGVGWGLGGFCPGPAVTSVVGGAPSVFAFLAAMLGASWLTGRLETGSASTRPRGTPASTTPRTS